MTSFLSVMVDILYNKHRILYILGGFKNFERLQLEIIRKWFLPCKKNFLFFLQKMENKIINERTKIINTVKKIIENSTLHGDKSTKRETCKRET